MCLSFFVHFVSLLPYFRIRERRVFGGTEGVREREKERGILEERKD